jgi:hypothetical protein
MGLQPAGQACKACARPISPPSPVTAALFDMFCGLNGRDRQPALARRPAQARDQQRLADIAAGALDHQRAGHLAASDGRPSEFDALLRLHPVLERMLGQRHLGHQIGRLDQLGLWRCGPSGRHGSCAAFASAEIDHLVDIKIIVAQRDVDLVQKHELDLGVEDLFLGDAPAVLRRRDIALAVLRFPGEALARDVEPAFFRETLPQKASFPPFPNCP